MELNKHDQVIRRLAQKLEFLAKDLVALTPPGEEDLHTYFEEHKQRYQQLALYTFIQVFIDPDKRGDATLDDTQKIKAELIALSSGQWHGPVLSGYGVHLVYVQEVTEPPAPRFADVRERVEQEWKSDKGEELNEQFYESLREQYTVVIEEPLKEGDDSTQGNQGSAIKESLAALQDMAR